MRIVVLRVTRWGVGGKVKEREGDGKEREEEGSGRRWGGRGEGCVK